MAIMRDELDGDAFVHLLRRAATRFGWALHAYCLMTNHFHLVVEGETDRLSAGMQALNWTFARRFNARYCRTGHVFEGRFRTRSVLDDPALGRVCAYVWNNPVAVGLVATPDEWRWSGSIPRSA